MDELNLRQISTRIEKIRPIAQSARIRTGWIKCIRQALGMKSAVLAKKIGVSQGTLAEMEKREAQGRITLQKLDQAAQALDCELIYAFVPKRRLEEYIDEAAEKKAKQLLSTASTHMELEDQRVVTDSHDRINALKEKLKRKGDIW